MMKPEEDQCEKGRCRIDIVILFYIKIDVILGVCCFIFILLNCFIIRVVSFIIYCEFISCLFNLNILLCMRGNSNLPPFDLYSLVRVVFVLCFRIVLNIIFCR